MSLAARRSMRSIWATPLLALGLLVTSCGGKTMVDEPAAEGVPDGSEGGKTPQPLYSGCPGNGTAPSPDRKEVARIVISASTNTPEADIVVYDDASAEIVLAPSRTANPPAAPPRSYPTCSPEVIAFLTDLAKVGDVSAIATTWCPKSVSFGTRTTISSGGKTSGDVQCLDNPSASTRLLAQDVEALTGTVFNIP
jgi:hypothetical protein